MIILLASILSLVIIVAWIGPNMNDAHDRLLINVHKVGLNENPGFVLGISGLGGTDILTAQVIKLENHFQKSSLPSQKHV